MQTTETMFYVQVRVTGRGHALAQRDAAPRSIVRDLLGTRQMIEIVGSDRDSSVSLPPATRFPSFIASLLGTSRECAR